jgi:hypothetical protein
VLSLAVNQQIKHTSRIRSAIDIVTKENLHSVPDWPGAQIIVNPGEQRDQKVGSPMNIAYSVNALSDRGARLSPFSGG